MADNKHWLNGHWFGSHWNDSHWLGEEQPPLVTPFVCVKGIMSNQTIPNLFELEKHNNTMVNRTSASLMDVDHLQGTFKMNKIQAIMKECGGDNS